jgi:hypothetical protein
MVQATPTSVKTVFSALGHLQYTEYDGEQQLSFVVDNLLETSNN